MTRMANDWPLHYFVKANTVRLYMSDKETISAPTTIVCQKPIDKSTYETTRENNILLQLAHHACRRDEKQIVTSTRYILTEIEAITNLNTATVLATNF